MNFETENELKQLSEELNLSFDSQDMGLINASSERVCEFIDYFEKKAVTTPVKFELFVLIVASYNDAIVQNIDKDEVRIKFMDFLNKNKGFPIYKPIIDYWKRIVSEEFPVGELLQFI